MSRKIRLNIPVKLTFYKAVTVEMSAGKLSRDAERLIKDAAEEAAWDWLEKKLLVYGGDANAAPERDWTSPRDGERADILLRYADDVLPDEPGRRKAKR